MKQLLLIFFYVLIALSIKGQYQAQVTDEGMDFPDYVDHVFEYMDLSQVPSGLLAERALRLIPLELYDGQTINDTTQLNFNIFNQVYYMAYAAAVGNPILPHPDNYYEITTGDTIPLGILLFDYDHLRLDAISAGIVDTINGQLHPVSGNTTSPYTAKKIMCHPTTNRTLNGDTT